MAVAANEPYQRVSRDNGVFDGALIGAAVGAGGAGAGVFGTRMNYNGIGKRVERDKANLESLESRQQKSVSKAEKAVSNADGPRFYQKRKYNKGNEAAENITSRGNRRETALNRSRVDAHNNLHNTATDAIHQETVGEARRQNQRNVDKGYNSPNTSMNDVRNSDAVTGARNAYLDQQGQIDAHYDSQVNSARNRTSHDLQQNPDVQYRDKVNQQIQSRVGKKQGKLVDKTHQLANTQNTLREMHDSGYVKKMQNNHAYSKHMGGWKNAAIIGASAVVGGGIGMLADGAIN
jgi:hypothetical protein